MDPLLDQKLISSKEAGEISGYSADYLARLARAKKIMGRRIGHAWLIDKNSLESFLKEQNERKSMYARRLSKEREEEYRAHRLSRQAVGSTAPKSPASVLSPLESIGAASARAHAVALAAAFLVVFGGLAGANVLARGAGDTIGTVAITAANGFHDAFLSPSPRAVGADAQTATLAARSDVSKILSLASAPRFALPQTRAQLAAALTPIAPAYASAAAHFGPEMQIQNRAEVAARMPVSPRTLASALSAAPAFARAIVLGFGSAIIDGTHAAIGADVTLAYDLAHAAPESAQVTTALALDVGNSLASVTASAPPLAAAATQSLALSGIDAVVRGAHAGTLAMANAADFLGKTLAPRTVEDSYLGLLGNTAAALDSFGAAISAAQLSQLSTLDRTALFTYETIHGGIVSVRAQIASLLSPASAPQVAANESSAATSTSTALTTGSATTTGTSTNAAAVAVAKPSAPSSVTYTTVVSGVDQNYVDQSIANLSAAVDARIADALRPVQNQVVTNETTIQQVNMIQDLADLTVTNGNFKGGVFDGGNLTNGGFVGATTGEFTNLTGGASTLTTLTLNGALTGYGAISAPYFTATSTTATSTFAGAFAVGTSTPFGNGLLTVGTSTPLLYIDNTTGAVGFGTTSPTEAFSVAGNSYFAGGLGVGIATTTPGALAVSGNAYVGGNLTVAGGSTVLGNSSTDSLVINSSIKSSIVPDQNITYDLGSPSFYWNNAYVQNLNANNISAASTTIGGTSDNTFTLNSDNVSSDQENSSLIFFRGSVVPNAILTWNAATSSKRFEFNQSLYINNASASTTEPTLTLQGVAGQTANILQIASSTGSTIFAVDSNGNATLNSLNLTQGLGLSAGGTATTTFYNGGVVFSDGTKLTQAANTNGNSLIWDNANGRFGIGTTSPGTLFSVSGNSNGSQTIATFATGNGLGDENLYINTDAARGLIGLQVKTGGGTVEPLILNGSGGNVGIGTTTPFGQLSINPNGISGPAFTVGSSTATNFIISNGGNVGIGTSTPSYKLGLWGSGPSGFFGISSTTLGDILNVASNGNVGIGTTSPSTILSVQNTVSSPQVRVAYDNTRYADLQVDSVGNLDITPQSGNIYTNDGNIFACAGGACPSGTIVGTGNLVAENHIGIGTSTPTDPLDIVANNPQISIRNSSVASGFTFGQDATGLGGIDNLANAPLVFATNNTERVRITSSGFLGIGTTSPTQQLSVANLLYVGAGGATGLGVATSTFQGDIKITGKLDVGTIDPVYTIDGVKYATYGHSTVGEKEEVATTLDVSDYDPTTKLYTYAIKFPELDKGSDLWLFYQITDFGQDWNNLVVSLTPTFDGTVFFKKDPQNHQLIVESTQPGQVTARFIANRFDWQHWPNIRPDQNTPDQTGFQLSAKN